MALRMSVSIDGVGKVIDRVLDIDVDAKVAQTAAAKRMAYRTVEEMAVHIREPKSGVHYSRYPRPSGTSGGYPAEQWGNLIEKMVVRVAKVGNATLTIGAGLPRPYAFWLEYGWSTKNGNFHIFPFVRPTVESLRDEYVDIVRTEVAKYIK